MLKSIYLMIAIIVISMPAHGQDNILSPEEAVRIALEKNYSVEINRRLKAIADNNTSIGNAGFLPEINLSGNQNYQAMSVEQEFIDGRIVESDAANSNSLNAEAEINWVVFDGMAMFNSYDRLKTISEIYGVNLRAEMESAASRVLDTYYSIVSENRLLEADIERTDISRQRVDIINSKYELGTASKLELLQSMVDLNADSAAVIDRRARIDNLKESLAELLASPVSNFKLIDTILVNSELRLDSLSYYAERENSAVQSAGLSITESEQYKKVVESGYYPELSLYGGYSYSKSESESGFLVENMTNGYNYGLSLRFNIFNGFNTRRQVENAGIERDIRQIALIRVKDSINTRLNREYNLYSKNLRLLELESANLEVARENMDIALERLRLGTYSAIEFREAQLGYTGALARLIKARFEAFVSQKNLLRLSGLLMR
ncbi:MAG: TolC family protein [Candidatus Kapaibacterium sp.]